MIFLLVGMMVIAHITAETGVFQWLVIRAVKIADGQPMRLLLVLSLVTALASAFLDNVTTVVLIVPVTIYIAETLGVKPRPFLISEILVANIGGAATLIGDPPNILIGSAAGLGFNAFLTHMTPPVVLILGLYLAAAPLIFRGERAGRASTLVVAGAGRRSGRQRHADRGLRQYHRREPRGQGRAPDHL